MNKDTDITKVVFRWWKVSKDVIALFPEIVDHYLCESYEHVGQHSLADYDGIIAESRPATPEEYAYLKEELELHYGYNFKVMQRRCSWTKLAEIRRSNVHS